jgi:hypothetical protein
VKVQILLKGQSNTEPPVLEVESVEIVGDWVQVTSVAALGLGGPWERRTTYTNRDLIASVLVVAPDLPVR